MKLTAQRLLFVTTVLPFIAQAAAVQPNLIGEWPTYGNGPAHTGYFPGTLNNLPFVQKWKTPVPSSTISQPAVAGGRVFVAAGYYYSAMTLRALDANTGAGLWTNSFTPAASLNPPTYDSGAVFIQRANNSTDSQIFSFNATNGASRWTNSFQSQSSKYFAPIVANGAVYADTGYYGGLTCYNQTNGALKFFTQIYGNGCWES
jgi:outer membrane protein assembly factor BamB